MDYNLQTIKTDFDAGRIETFLDFLWGTHKAAIIETFANKGIILAGKKDMVYLAALHQTGQDVEGVIKNSAGEPIHFSVFEILKTVPIDMKQIKKGEVIKRT